MALGSLKQVLICLPNSQMGGKPDYGNCGSIGGVAHRYTVQQFYLVDPSNASLFDNAFAPIDYVLAGQIFAFFFSGAVLLYWVSRSAETVISVIRKF